MYIYICVCIYTCIYIYIYIHVYTHIYTYIYTCVCIYIYIYLFIYLYINTHILYIYLFISATFFSVIQINDELCQLMGVRIHHKEGYCRPFDDYKQSYQSDLQECSVAERWKWLWTVCHSFCHFTVSRRRSQYLAIQSVRDAQAFSLLHWQRRVNQLSTGVHKPES